MKFETRWDAHTRALILNLVYRELYISQLAENQKWGGCIEQLEAIHISALRSSEQCSPRAGTQARLQAQIQTRLLPAL